MDAEVHKRDNDNPGDERDEVVLDVRPLIERGEEPFGTIMQTVAALDGRSLLLVAPFEPTPLQGVLSAQGFTYQSERVSDTHWRVRFEPGDVSRATETSSGAGEESGEVHAAGGAGTVSAPVDPVVSTPAVGSVSESSTATASPYTIKRRTPTSAPAGATQGAGPGSGTRTERSTGQPVVPPSVMAMNPTLNVPPAWLPLGFMAAAGAGLIGFGIALMVTAPTAVESPSADQVKAAVHFGVLAFLSTAVLGALHQFGPVVGGKPLRSIAAGVVTGVLFIPGVWLIPLGFATGNNVILQIGGVSATTAVCIAAWNVSRPLSASGRGAPIVGLRLAVAYLVVTVAFGITYAFNRGPYWFVPLPNRLLAHAHIGLLGWLGLAYVAVAEKLWPMFLLAHRPHVRDGERAVWLVGAGAPVVTIGLLWPSSVVTIVGGVLVVAGLGSHLASLASVIRYRRRGLELLHGFVLASAACLLGAMVLGIVAGLARMDFAMRQRLVAAEVICVILWLALAVVGHSHKIVPFISWNRLRDRGITKGRDDRPLLFAHLVNQDLARVTFGLAVLGAATGVIGVLTTGTVLVRVAGAALALTGVTAIVNLVSGPLLMIRWHNQQQDRPRDQMQNQQVGAS